MRITVINGSPKGAMGVTVQYAEYLKKAYPGHGYEVFHVAQKIGTIEKDTEEFDRVMNAVRASDLVIWAFPLYILHVHANLKRFIELVFERGAEGAFAGKYAASISTSIKFFDNLANDYMHAISEDLGMRFAGFYAAEMDDLKKPDKRRTLEAFAERVFRACENREALPRRYAPLSRETVPYAPTPPDRSIDAEGKRIVVVADEIRPGTNLARMIDSFASRFAKDIEIVDLSTVDIRGGCLGCLRCGYDNTCFWEGKDGFIEMYNGTLKRADVIVFAGETRDRYLSSRWKNFFDRAFFNTHQPSLEGKQWAFLISGHLRGNETLRTIIQAWTEFQQSGLAGIVTDEDGDSALLDGQIQSLAEHAVWAAGRGYITTETFLRVGGMKIFRDEVFGQLRAVFQADYRFYLARGYFDFPQRKLGMRLFNRFIFLLFKIRPIRDRFYTAELIPGMVSGQKRVVGEAKVIR